MIDYYEISCHYFKALIRPIHQERTENATLVFPLPDDIHAFLRHNESNV